MIAFTFDRFQRANRWTYFWSDRGPNSPSLRQKSRWRGALSIYWRMAVLVRRNQGCLPEFARGTCACAWTGRHEPVLGVRPGLLAVYLRTPCGRRWEWKVGT